MWYIDMSGGFSPAGLFVALLKIIDDNKSKYIKACRTAIHNKRCLFYHQFPREEFFDLEYIKNHCKGADPFQIKEIEDVRHDLLSILSAILSLSGEDTINYFDFYLYFLLIVLMEELNLKTELYILSPTIGTGSPESSVSLFRGIIIILDPAAHTVSPLSAAFCHYYKSRISPGSKGRLISVLYLPIPFSDNKVVKLFECSTGMSMGCSTDYEYDIVSILETNIDDSTPEIISGVMTYLLNQGALDYTVAPVMMKKGRNGFHIQVLCNLSDSDKIGEILLHQTSSFGLRIYETRRTKLRRRLENIETKYGTITVKLGYRGNHLIKAVPEFDDLNRIAITQNIPLFNLYNEIMGEIKKGIDCFAKDGKIERL